MPTRIQRKRTKGWKMPEDAIYVGRPTKYANHTDWRVFGREEAKEDYRHQLIRWRSNAPEAFQQTLNKLRGHDLACWCPLDKPCHADVWLELANRKTPQEINDEFDRLKLELQKHMEWRMMDIREHFCREVEDLYKLKETELAKLKEKMETEIASATDTQSSQTN